MEGVNIGRFHSVLMMFVWFLKLMVSMMRLSLEILLYFVNYNLLIGDNTLLIRASYEKMGSMQ